MTRAGRVLVALFAIGSGLVAAPATSGSVVCRARSGAVAARERCRRREQAITLDASVVGPVGAAGVPGPAGAPGAPGRTPQVVDAAGTPIGVAADPSLGAVLLRVDGLLVLVRLGSAAVADSPPVAFGHAKSNCSDAPTAVRHDPEALVRPAGLSGGTLYYAAEPVAVLVPNAIEETLSVQACATAPGIATPSGRCCHAAHHPGSFGPAAAVPPAMLGTTPYRFVP